MNLETNEALLRAFKISFVANGKSQSQLLELRLNNYGKIQFPTVDNYSSSMVVTVDY